MECADGWKEGHELMVGRMTRLEAEEKAEGRGR